MGLLISFSKIITPEDKEIDQLNTLNQSMTGTLQKIKYDFANKLVSQERKIIDVYVSQIKTLKEKFEKEFQEKIKKLD